MSTQEAAVGTAAYLHHAYPPVVVAMVSVRVMKVPVHQVVHVIAVGNLLVTAVRAMPMVLLMPVAGVIGGTGNGVGRIDL